MKRVEKCIHKAKKRAHSNKIFEELEYLQGRHEAKKFYQRINKDRKEFKPRTNLVKNGDGIIISNRDGIVNRWKKCFAELLANNTNERISICEQQDTVIDEDPPSLEEVRAAINKLQNNRTPGEDTIPAELIKIGDASLISRIHGIATDIWN